jgi:hypothetical protein
LCCSKEWKEEWKGIKFARLYVLLREQFTHSDDPWCVQTLKWWNEFVVQFIVPILNANNLLENCLWVPSRRTRNPQERLGTRRVHRHENAWITSGERGCKRQQGTEVFERKKDMFCDM